MTAPGFCTCKRDFPQRDDFHPPANATWHFLCDKPVLSASLGTAQDDTQTSGLSQDGRDRGNRGAPSPVQCPHHRGAIDWDSGAWHCYACGAYTFDAEPEPDEAQRIAEVFDEARAELDRGL